MLILSDNQDITRAGLQWLCSEMKHNDIAIATDKTTLARLLEGQEHATVVLDYTLFDFTSFDELLIWQQRFHRVQWLLFSETLTSDFVRVVVASGPRFGLILKDAPLPQIAKPCTMPYAESHTTMRPLCKWPMNNGKKWNG